MKKLLAILMALAMLFAFAGCGSKDDDDKDTNKDGTSTFEKEDEENEKDKFDKDDNDDENDEVFCDVCDDRIKGKVYEAEGYGLCKDCYEEYLEYSEEEEDYDDYDDYDYTGGESLADLADQLSEMDFSNEYVELKVKVSGNNLVYYGDLLVDLEPADYDDFADILGETYDAVMPDIADQLRAQVSDLDYVVVEINSQDGDRVFYEKY